LADLIECIREYELWNDNALLQFTKTAWLFLHARRGGSVEPKRIR
jgi:hypothetical protein